MHSPPRGTNEVSTSCVVSVELRAFGDDELARTCLILAFESQPHLKGAERISRALGLSR